MRITNNSGSSTTILVYIAIFLSGLAFLIFEINLFKSLSNLLGATVIASTLVLSVFMGGYGLGSLYFGKKATPVSDPIPLLAATITLLGISGMASYTVISAIMPNLQTTMIVSTGSKVMTNTVVYTLVILLLFIPSFFMGGVLPCATKAVSILRNEISRTVGLLYALDTLGSAIGAILSGFLLNRLLGQYQTIAISALLLLTAAVTLYRNRHKYIPDNIGISQSLPSSFFDIRIRGLILTIALLFGLSMNIVQVVFIRIFKIYVINTVYSFTMISSITIIGLFLGSYLFKRLSVRCKFTGNTMIFLLLLFGTLTFINITIIERIPQILMFPINDIVNSHILRAIVLPAIISLFTLLPLAIVSGFSFPLACTLYSKKIDTISGDIGMVLLFNTLGAVAGPLAATFILIPKLGIASGLALLSGVLFALSALFSLKIGNLKLSRYYTAAGMVGVIAVILIAVTGGEKKILPPSFIKNNRTILAYKESIEGSYVVGEDIVGPNNRVLVTYVNNSAVIGTTYDAIKAVKMVGHIPFLLGLECSNALVVGFGIGVTTAAIGVHSDVKSIDCVELVSDLKNVAHFYSDINNNIHTDKRVTFYEDDGRHFLQTTNKQYDLISSDPTHPILGSGSLYTLEYFKLCYNRLSDKGMVSQYMPLHKLSISDFLGILKTFNAVFPNSTVWLGHYHAVLIGAKQPISIDFDIWKRNMLKTADDKLFLNNPYHLAACLVFDSGTLRAVTEPYRVNTDNVAYTDYFSFNSLSDSNIAVNLDFLDKNRSDLSHIFMNIDDSVIMQRFVKGNSYLTKGLVAMFRNNKPELINFIEKACMVNPENVEYQLLLDLYGQ